MKRILVIGSSNTDMVIRVDRIPRPGETVLGGKFSMTPGGKGANQAVAAARAGGSVALIARVGSDVFGTRALVGFRKEGLDVGHVSRDRQVASGVALIFVDRKAENSIGVASGANSRCSPADIRRAAKAIQSAACILIQLEIPMETVHAAVSLAARSAIPVILNPAPAQRLDAKLLRRVFMITPNEMEAEALTGIPADRPATAEKAAKRLLRLGVKNVVMTLGSRGALIANAEGVCLVPVFKVQPVDTTAAGDVFNGTLAVALVEGCPLPEAVRFANAAAAISVTRQGAQPSAPTRREIDRLISRYPGRRY